MAGISAILPLPGAAARVDSPATDLLLPAKAERPLPRRGLSSNRLFFLPSFESLLRIRRIRTYSL